MTETRALIALYNSIISPRNVRKTWLRNNIHAIRHRRVDERDGVWRLRGITVCVHWSVERTLRPRVNRTTMTTICCPPFVGRGSSKNSVAITARPIWLLHGKEKRNVRRGKNVVTISVFTEHIARASNPSRFHAYLYYVAAGQTRRNYSNNTALLSRVIKKKVFSRR